MRKPATTKLRNAVVRAFNRGKTQAEVAAELGLTRGVVGRLLAGARAMGIPVVRYSKSEAARRSQVSARTRMGEAAYCAIKAAMRSRQAAGKASA